MTNRAALFFCCVIILGSVLITVRTLYTHTAWNWLGSVWVFVDRQVLMSGLAGVWLGPGNGLLRPQLVSSESSCP